MFGSPAGRVSPGPVSKGQQGGVVTGLAINNRLLLMRTFALLLSRATTTPADADCLRTHLLADGIGFPPSYIDFATQLGWGRRCGLWLVYVPLGQYCDSWLMCSPVIEQAMKSFYAEEGDDYLLLLEPDGYPGLRQSLVPFAMSENGAYLVWDLARRNAENELPLYVIASRMGGIHFGAENLYQFVESCPDYVAAEAAFGSRYDPAESPIRALRPVYWLSYVGQTS